MSGFADFGSFFSPAAAQKFSPAAGSGQSLFHFFASGGQSLFQKKSACGGLRAITFPFFASGGQSLFQKIPACGGLRAITFPFFRLLRSITFPKKSPAASSGQSLFHFFTFAVNHFSKKIAFGSFGQSLFHFFTSGVFSATHFPFFTFGGQSLFQKKSPPADFRSITFPFFRLRRIFNFRFSKFKHPQNLILKVRGGQSLFHSKGGVNHFYLF